MKQRIKFAISCFLLITTLSSCGTETTGISSDYAESDTEIITGEALESVSAETIKETPSFQNGRTSKDLNIIFQYYGGFDYWELYDFSNTLIPTQEIYEEVITTYIAKIEKLYSLTDWWNYSNPQADTLIFVLQVSDTDAFYISGLEKGLSNEVQATLTIPKKVLTAGDRVDNKLAHELTHMMIDCFSISLEEGLANYTATKVGSSRKAIEYNGMDPQVSKKLNIETFINYAGLTDEEVNEVAEVVGDGAINYNYFRNQDQLALLIYQYSQSFVTYLIDIYGQELVIDFMQNGNDNSSYETYLGKDLATIRQEWLAYFDSIDANIDTDYYNNLMNDYVYELDLD